MSYYFIKPSKAKIILTIVIAVLHIVSALYSGMAFLCDAGSCPKPNALQKILFPSFLIITPIKYLTDVIEHLTFLSEIFASILISITIIVILLSFWYLLACLLIKAYYFFNKKNKNKSSNK